MRRIVGSLVLAVLLLGGSPAAAAPAGPSGPAAELFALVNGERAAAAGLPALQWRDDAAEIAESWSATMAASGVLAHNDAYFSDATRSRLGSARRAENVAMGESVAGAHAWLLDSPHHLANILDPSLTHAGFGAARSAAGEWWVTEAFLTPSGAPSAPPVPPPPAPPVTAPPATAAPVPTAPAPTALPPTAAPPAPPTTVAPPPTAPPTTAAPTTTAPPPTTAAAAIELAAAPAGGSMGPVDPVEVPTPLALVALAALAVPSLGLLLTSRRHRIATIATRS